MVITMGRKMLAFIAAMFIFVPFTAKADGYDELSDIIPQEVRNVMEEMDIHDLDTETAAALSPTDFIAVIIPNVEKSIKKPLASIGGIMCVMLLAAVLNILKRNDTGSKMYDIVTAAVCGLCVLTPVSEVVTKITAVTQASTDFMLGYVPVYTGLVITSGSPTAAAGYGTALLTVCEVVSQLADKVILPITGMVLGLSVLSGISSNELFSKLPAAAKSVTRWVFVTACSLFVSLLSIQNVIAGASDSLLIKSGKMFASFVPVVGSALSDAFSVTAGSVMMIRSGVGLFGILIILILFLPPLFELLIWIGGIKLIIAASDTLGTHGMKRVLTGVGDALDMMLAIYTSLGALFVISTAVMVKMQA